MRLLLILFALLVDGEVLDIFDRTIEPHFKEWDRIMSEIKNNRKEDIE